jgi:hypothetical protein
VFVREIRAIRDSDNFSPAGVQKLPAYKVSVSRREVFRVMGGRNQDFGAPNQGNTPVAENPGFKVASL